MADMLNRWSAMCILLMISTACSGDAELRPFASDGCSLFPDSSLLSESDWCSCCFEHDLQYWRGGTREEREASDRQLERCVLEKTGNNILAGLMYQGVRAGGSPYFYSWYRWGYGWSFERKYQSLTPQEHDIADDFVKKYFAENGESACPI